MTVAPMPERDLVKRMVMKMIREREAKMNLAVVFFDEEK